VGRDGVTCAGYCAIYPVPFILSRTAWILGSYLATAEVVITFTAQHEDERQEDHRMSTTTLAFLP
jgi:hypothetical protein